MNTELELHPTYYEKIQCLFVDDFGDLHLSYAQRLTVYNRTYGKWVSCSLLDWWIVDSTYTISKVNFKTKTVTVE